MFIINVFHNELLNKKYYVMEKDVMKKIVLKFHNIGNNVKVQTFKCGVCSLDKNVCCNDYDCIFITK